MQLKQIYDLVVKFGIEEDPRGREIIEKELALVKEKYEKLSEEEKKEFDLKKLTNPYSDTRILYGEETLEVETILVGIDMEGEEVLLADRLREKGERIDLIISHHPEGTAFAGFYEVMRMHADILNKYGVPINVSEGILKERMNEVGRKVLPVNHQRAIDIARILKIPFMSIHTPADNHVTSYLDRLFKEKKPYLVREIIKCLKEIPEYKEAAENKAGPTVIVGSEENRAGQIFVDMTGGTEGSKKAFEKLTQAGQVSSIVGMHFSEEHRKEAEKNHVNLIVAGHIASDNLGLNLLFDKLTREEKLKIITCSGYRRICRNG